MKLKVIFGFVIGVCTLLIIYSMSKTTSEHSIEHHRAVHYYNPQKINLNGDYQPFFGYTIAAMIDRSLSTFAQQIEQFLQQTKFAVSYSPLPAHTYHMTIFSIYQCGNEMIPPVKRWVNTTGLTISNSKWLPDEVLQEQNDKAMCIIEKYLTEPLLIKYASLNVSERGIKLQLEVDETGVERIRMARDEFVKIYEHVDLPLEPIEEKLHLGLAYVYAPTGRPNRREWNQLNKLVGTFNGGKLMLPSVYLFDSMTNYIPYRKRREC